MLVRCHLALGVDAWRLLDYQAAYDWIQLAEAEQTRFGGSWVPDVSSQRQRLEGLMQK